jgi:ferredoxin
MDITSARLIYFSPTRTTRNVIEAIAQGMHAVQVEHVDLMPHAAAIHEPAEMHDDLAIIGCPVYGGRLPSVAVARLRRLNGSGTPAVIVVVYGNREYEDALLELKDLAVETGFEPVAAGAFIGEHSYSRDDTPIAAGRPDGKDSRQAIAFGKAVRAKMMAVQALDELPPLRVPGKFPYKDWVGLSGIAPVTDEAACARCGACASVCPTAAIVVRDTPVTDRSSCIKCCACVKTCATDARGMDDPCIRQVAEQLSMNCRERKEPEMYL